MDKTSHWKLAQSLNIHQIALLMLGYDPTGYAEIQPSEWREDIRREAEPLLTALRNAVLENDIDQTQAIYEEDDRGNRYYDWINLRIKKENLINWLIKSEFYDLFFRREQKIDESNLQTRDESYPPKLAAALAAWRTVTANPDMLRGKTPKTALIAWLTEHASEYGLLNANGTPARKAIAEIGKVANWSPKGGVAPTPSTAPNSGPNSNQFKAQIHPKPGPMQLKPLPPPGKKSPESQPEYTFDKDVPF